LRRSRNDKDKQKRRSRRFLLQSKFGYPYQQICQAVSREHYPSIGNPSRANNVAYRKHGSRLSVTTVAYCRLSGSQSEAGKWPYRSVNKFCTRVTKRYFRQSAKLEGHDVVKVGYRCADKPSAPKLKFIEPSSGHSLYRFPAILMNSLDEK
jgi:hypothetical protein